MIRSTSPAAASPPSPGVLRWVAVGIAFAVFGVVDLILLVLLPSGHRATGAITSMVGAGVILITLPLLLSLFERQEDRIEGQRRELEILHAMDAAIIGEVDMAGLLRIAVRSAIRVTDAEAGGIALFHPHTGKLLAEEYEAVGFGSEEQERLRAITRSGLSAPEDEWEVSLFPLGQREAIASGATGRVLSEISEELLRLKDKRNGAAPPPAAPLRADSCGYLMAARRRVPGRGFSREDTALLKMLAASVDVAIASAFAREAARDSVRVREELARERRVARALTEGLLPEIPVETGEWRFARRYEPQSAEAQVGGDIYDLFPLGKALWGVVIADVSGKGLAAARKTAMVKYSLRSYAREHSSPAAVLARLNNVLADETDLTGFVTLLYGVLDEKTGAFRYASAGHETPVLSRVASRGELEVLEPTGMVLGAAPDQPYEESVVFLQPGDGLLLYTDGLSEARSLQDGSQLEVEGVARLVEAVRAQREERSGGRDRAMTDRIWDALAEFTGGKMRDDTALLWVERVAVAEIAPSTPETLPLALAAGAGTA